MWHYQQNIGILNFFFISRGPNTIVGGQKGIVGGPRATGNVDPWYKKCYTTHLVAFEINHSLCDK